MKTKENKSRTAAANKDALPPAQEVFIHAMIQGATATEAYLEAYPNCTREAAYSSSSRLMHQPVIRQRIREGSDEIRRRKNAQARQDIVNNIERIDARLQTLADVINGDWVRKDTCINKDTGVIIERYREDPSSAIQAIKLEMKLLDCRAQLVAELNLLDHPAYDPKNELHTMTDEELDATIRHLLQDTEFSPLPLSTAIDPPNKPQTETKGEKIKRLKT